MRYACEAFHYHILFCLRLLGDSFIVLATWAFIRKLLPSDVAVDPNLEHLPSVYLMTITNRLIVIWHMKVHHAVYDCSNESPQEFGNGPG